MRRAIGLSCLVMLGGLVGPSAAAAEIPVENDRAILPSGLVLELSRGTELIVRRDKLRASLYHEPRWRGSCPDGNMARHGSCGMSLGHVTTKDDGTITVDLEWGGIVSYRPGELEAHLELAAAARQPAPTALATIEHAVALDPLLWDATRELALRQLAAKRREPAAATVAAWLRRDPIAGYHRLLLEPRLAGLLGQPAIAALRAPTPGKLRLKDLNETGAWSATLGVVAVEIEERIKTTEHAGYDETDQLVVFQRLDADEPALVLARSERAQIERLLRDFDFRADPNAEIATVGYGAKDEELTFENAKLSLTLERAEWTNNKFTRSDDKIHVLRDGKPVTRSRCSVFTMTGATFLPAAGVVVVKESESGSAGMDGLCVIGVPALR
jgi:hypothetical protein